MTDEDYNRKFRKEAEDEAGKLDTETWRNLRKLAKTDLFFLSYGILGFNKISTNLHGNLTEWMRLTRNYLFRLLLLPRGHYKSTIWTISHSIQAALPDDTGEELWPYCLGPDIRICLMHEVQSTASKFLSSIQNHFLSNVALMRLFPECIPDPKRQTINMLQLELPRNKFWVEKTFEVMGVGGRSQGNHYNLLKPDDLIGKEAADSKVIMASTIEWVDNIQSFLTSFASGDRIDFNGTHWGHDDLYFHIKEFYGDDLAVYRRAVEEKNEETGKMESIFPEEYPQERLRILRKNRKIFSAQYLNDPESDATDLGVDKLRYYYWKSRKTVTIFDKITSQNVDYDLNEMHKLLMLDPAKTGSTAIIVTGIPKHFKVIILEAIQGSYTTPKLLDLVCTTIIKWGIKEMIVESVVFSALYEDLLIAEFLKRGIKCKVTLQRVPSGLAGEKSGEGKFRKLKTLAVYLDAFQLYVNEMQVDLWHQFRKFGTSLDVHLLDAIWLGTKHWRCFDPIRDGEVPVGSIPLKNRLDKISGYSTAS